MEKNLEISDAKAIRSYGRDLLSGVWSPGSIFYVDTAANGGDDTNNGSYDSPVLKVNAAMDLCTANKGDVIQVRGNSPSSPNDTATITMDVAGVTLRGLYGRGLLSDSGFGSPTINVPTITIAANYVTIEDLYLGVNSSGSSGGVIEFTGNTYGVAIRRCTIEHQYAATYGIYLPDDQPFLLIEDNFFGRLGSTNFTDPIRLGNCTSGIIRRNIIAGYSGVGINDTGNSHHLTILKNTILLPSDTEGKGISIAAGSTDNWIDDNHAGYGNTTMNANPYKDGSGADANHWGLNYAGIVATLPA